MPPKLFITERDIEIFYALTKYRLTGQMVYELSKKFKQPFSSPANTRARLNLLYGAGFLRRDERLMKGRGNNQYYYFLTMKSAGFLPELEGIEPKNIIFHPQSISRQAHSFLISELMLKLETDCWAMKDICEVTGFIRENCFEVKGNNRVIRPDGTIFLNVNGQNHLLFLEADRSTEVVNSQIPNKRTFERKLQIYTEFKTNFWQNEVIHNCFTGIQGYRVLIVCRTSQRMQNLLDIAKKTTAPNMFWFTTVDRFLNNTRDSLFDKIWTLPDGRENALF